jgi:hypothetical protein
MRRELETWPRENCEPIEQSKELDWKPSPYSARQFSTLPGSPRLCYRKKPSTPNFSMLSIFKGIGWKVVFFS